jgi:hypothetical protein
MPRSCEPLTRIARKGRSAAYAAMALFAALIVNAGLARADDTYSKLTTIPVQANTTNCSGSTSLAHFDISWVDSLLNLYVLSDRTNCSVDVFDINTNKELFFVGGFSGQQGTNNGISGPDGVLTVNGRYVFAGNGDSTVRVLDLFSQSQIADITIPLPTGVTAGNRADEMAYDSRDHIVAVANDSPSPTTASPYLTFISTTPTNPAVFGILGQVVIADATSANGLEQTAYSSKTGLFYTSVPVIGTGTTGEIAVINPVKRRIVGHFPVSCQPAGLAIGPNLEAMVGCSDGPVQIVSLKTGAMLASFPTLTNADEVWFNKSSRQYFVAAGSNMITKGKKTTPAPVLGVVNADTHALDQLIPTTVGDHSVAVDATLNHVFLPDTSNATPAGCGCIQVFNVTGEDVAAK